MIYKNTLIKIKKSLGRYLSLFIIVMVGVGFYAGIQSSAPDIKKLADRYYDDHQLMDFKVVSTLGLTEDDADALQSLMNVDTVTGSYSLDVMVKDKILRIHAIEDEVNTVKLVSGRMPEKDSECIADESKYKIGDIISISHDEKDNIKNLQYTVTGLVESVLYIADDYGNTTIGDGKLKSFILIPKDNFTMEVYTEIYLVLTGASDRIEYSKEYDTLATQLNDALVNIKGEREDARYEEIYSKAEKEIKKNENKLKDEETKGQKELTKAKAQLDDGDLKIKDGKASIAKNETALQQNIETQNARFNEERAKIKEGWKEVDSALLQAGLTRENIGEKINELSSGIGEMETQLSQLHKNSVEYKQILAQMKQYTKQYNGLIKLKESIDGLYAGEMELNKGIEMFHTQADNAKKEIADAKQELADKEEKIRDGYKEYNKNLKKFNTEILDAENKIADAKSDLTQMEHPEWIIFDRDVVTGYSEFKTQIEVITSVAAVFPVFFILIVVLMTSNTTARMIAEERGELGTLTSLGYKDRSIISTYLLYVLSASGLGAIIGFFAGCRIFPPLIYKNFQFKLPPLILYYDVKMLLIIMGVTLAVMSAVTLFACYKELRQKPAALMRPLPPKHGQKILLEKAGFIWKRLSFTWKVTMRNMFRYKKRAFMTIVGVAGCASLLLVGFGLRDSTRGVVERQYGEIFRYDNMIMLKDETQEINKELEDLLQKQQITNPLLMRQNAVKCETGQNSLNTYLIVPENISVFEDYYHLYDISGKSRINLTESGVIISQKIAEACSVGKGDKITIKDADNQVYSFVIADVAENYTSNYIYMTTAQYNEVFEKTAFYNTIISSADSVDLKELTQHLMGSDMILNVVLTDDIMDKAIENNQNLDSIIVLIVVVASLLAIVVLYNLTSINISERTREIATLKVLGFRDGETNSYIYREALILTIISIAIGMIAGVFLHRFVVAVIEGTSMVLIKKIKLQSFIFASLITLVFSLIMQMITYFKLKTIDMIQSLKSVE